MAIDQSGGRSQLLRNLFEVVTLNDIADLVLREIAELDSAFDTGTNLFDVVLKSPQRGDAAIVNGLPFSEHAGARSPGDSAVRHIASRNGASRKLEDLLDLGMPDYSFPNLGIKQPDHRFLHLIDELINDAVKLDLNPFALGCCSGLILSLDIEADDHRVRGGCQEHIRF